MESKTAADFTKKMCVECDTGTVTIQLGLKFASTLSPWHLYSGIETEESASQKFEEVAGKKQHSSRMLQNIHSRSDTFLSPEEGANEL